MEVGTLANLFPGRITIAFGHGVESWMEQIGARPPDRIARLRAVAGAVAELTRGQVVDRSGDIHLDRVRLDQPPSIAPDFLVGTTGPRGLAVAHALGFGLLPEGAGPAAIREAREFLSGESQITVYSWLLIVLGPPHSVAAEVPWGQAFSMVEHRPAPGPVGPPLHRRERPVEALHVSR
jgi:hypothetical protein